LESKRIRQKKIFPSELLEKYNPITLQLLSGRGLKNEKDIEEYFSFDYEKDLGDPNLISGMAEAVERIGKAKEDQEKIAIFGDYDADGVSSSALLFEVFSDLGFQDIICYIPDRQTEGYGMNDEALEYLSKEKVNLVVTVDCGITNISEVEKAKELGMDVIVTDHHYALEKIPGAHAVINPTIPNSGFEFGELAGVGVAFKLAGALYQKQAPDKQEKLKWLLDLVALGTVADCVPLLSENRTLVKYGLIVFSKTKRVGLQEMFKVGRIEIGDGKIPDARKIAFQVAPRINAAGRMDHANVAYSCSLRKIEPLPMRWQKNLKRKIRKDKK
jgi:single-stranded-DNA-specific exonuclease